jgi:hypothetical protein
MMTPAKAQEIAFRCHARESGHPVTTDRADFARPNHHSFQWLLDHPLSRMMTPLANGAGVISVWFSGV